jgi:purine-binding chemotaxis protein CheW
MTTPGLLVLFCVDSQRFALGLENVDKVIPFLAITPLPGAPSVVLGIFDLHGDLVPVLNVRARFKLHERTPLISDQLLVAHISERRVALLVDAVTGVEHAEGIVNTQDLVHDSKYISGIVPLENGLVLIHDLERFLLSSEEIALDDAMGEYARAQSQE